MNEQDQWSRTTLFSALRPDEALEVFRLEREGQIGGYGFSYGLQKENEDDFLSREELLSKLDDFGWRNWTVEAKGLMKDFQFGMAVLDRVRNEDQETWRSWLRSAGWLQATVSASGLWGERVLALLGKEELGRHAVLASSDQAGVLSDQDKVRILLMDPNQPLSKRVEEWIRGDGDSLSFIFVPTLPEVLTIPGAWIEISPQNFRGTLEEILQELLEGCYPFGILSNGFAELLPYFKTPRPALATVLFADNEDWMLELVDEVLTVVGWDERWKTVQLLFFLLQTGKGMLEPEHLYNLSTAVQQGVRSECRVVANIRENLSWADDEARMLLIGLLGEPLDEKIEFKSPEKR